MAGTSPAMTLRIMCSTSHSSCPRIAVRRTACLRTPMSRASTSLQHFNRQDVDGRNKSGHDAAHLVLDFSFVMPAHSRPKDGVLTHAYVAGIHVFATFQQARRGWPEQVRP